MRFWGPEKMPSLLHKPKHCRIPSCLGLTQPVVHLSGHTEHLRWEGLERAVLSASEARVPEPSVAELVSKRPLSLACGRQLLAASPHGHPSVYLIPGIFHSYEEIGPISSRSMLATSFYLSHLLKASSPGIATLGGMASTYELGGQKLVHNTL